MGLRTSFNDLSNELFLEIFDYLDVFDLFRTFQNLNQRLNSLIIDRRIIFQANLLMGNDEQLSMYKNMILPKVGQYLRHLTITDEYGYFESLFNSMIFRDLLSVRLYQIKLHQLRSILDHCQLKSLYIQTKFIQNEKHLNDIFHHLVNHQPKLRRLQCNFYTNLHFIEEKVRLSELRRVIIDCSCFSSDLIYHDSTRIFE